MNLPPISLYFWKTYALFLGVLVLLVAGIQYLWPFLLIKGVWAFVFFFAVLIPIVYFLALAGIKRNDGSSVLIILGANVIKMIISLVLCAWYIIRFGATPVIFAGNFFILYIAFTLFEIHCLLHNLRLPNKENNSSNK